jgi:hypothetical protein
VKKKTINIEISVEHNIMSNKKMKKLLCYSLERFYSAIDNTLYNSKNSEYNKVCCYIDREGCNMPVENNRLLRVNIKLMD